MAITYLKLENDGLHEYFVNTVYDILTRLGMDYTLEDIEAMALEDGYCIYLHNKKTKRWHLGIWAVGEWGIKEEFDGDVIDGGYGFETYKPKSISVFLIHDWTYDKFRPSRANWEGIINYNEDIDDVVNEVKYYLEHPIKSYYIIVDEDSYNCQHKEKNRYIAYLKGWYHNVFNVYVYKKHQRICGFILTNILMLIARLDWRVFHCEYKFHNSNWNPEYDAAIVFKYGRTEWHDWKRWHDYDRIFRLFQKMCHYNLYVEFTYLDEEGNMPKNIWRGVYWEEEPER